MKKCGSPGQHCSGPILLKPRLANVKHHHFASIFIDTSIFCPRSVPKFWRDIDAWQGSVPPVYCDGSQDKSILLSQASLPSSSISVLHSMITLELKPHSHFYTFHIMPFRETEHSVTDVKSWPIKEPVFDVDGGKSIKLNLQQPLISGCGWFRRSVFSTLWILLMAEDPLKDPFKAASKDPLKAAATFDLGQWMILSRVGWSLDRGWFDKNVNCPRLLHE